MPPAYKITDHSYDVVVVGATATLTLVAWIAGIARWVS